MDDVNNKEPDNSSADWSGTNGTKKPEFSPAEDPNGWPNDSHTGDADVGF